MPGGAGEEKAAQVVPAPLLQPFQEAVRTTSRPGPGPALLGLTHHHSRPPAHSDTVPQRSTATRRDALLRLEGRGGDTAEGLLGVRAQVTKTTTGLEHSKLGNFGSDPTGTRIIEHDRLPLKKSTTGERARRGEYRACAVGTLSSTPHPLPQNPPATKPPRSTCQIKHHQGWPGASNTYRKCRCNEQEINFIWAWSCPLNTPPPKIKIITFTPSNQCFVLQEIFCMEPKQ